MWNENENDDGWPDFEAALKSDLVNPERNIYFVQFGSNPHNLSPGPGDCAIDHSGIDWGGSVDVYGGFGIKVELDYDDDSFFGVNFFKADNVTPLGLQNSCTSTPNKDSNLFAPQMIRMRTYMVTDKKNGSYKSIFGGWKGSSGSPIKSE